MTAYLTDQLDFRRTYQEYNDHWRNTIRPCRYVGECILCHRRTFEFDDGENDPRGALGEHAADVFVAQDYGMVGPNVPCCFMCHSNEEHLYRAAKARAKKLWKYADA